MTGRNKNCHCEERSDVAIRLLLPHGKGERIATPVCGLVRNDSRVVYASEKDENTSLHTTWDFF